MCIEIRNGFSNFKYFWIFKIRSKLIIGGNIREKINFKNYPDTSTPLSAETFNEMQNNIEDAIEATIPSDSDWQNLGYGTGYESPRIWLCPTI